MISEHILIYSTNGDLHAYGNNKFGQLGVKDDYKSSEIKVMNDPNILMIHTGWHHSLILMKNGELYAFGRGDYGFGFGNFENIPQPKLLMKDPQIKILACGEVSTLIYKSNGDLLGFGFNRFGQLGFKNELEESHKDIIKVMNDPNIVEIKSGLSSSFLFKRNGDIYAFGRNDEGQLGINNNIDQFSPVLFRPGKDIKLFEIGGSHACFLTNGGDLFFFGYNEYGQLGLGDEKSRSTPSFLLNDPGITQISLGKTFHVPQQQRTSLCIWIQ